MRQALLVSLTLFTAVARADEPVCPQPDPLPKSAASFTEVTDDAAKALLTPALGEAGKGGLCEGRVYEVGAPITLFRAWNSTNPRSELGAWWSFTAVRGAVRDYRAAYEICYQWSPLDMMVQCTLPAGTRVVVGTGQSAKCSDYLTYPASSALQVYISDTSVLTDCTRYGGVFKWRREKAAK